MDDRSTDGANSTALLIAVRHNSPRTVELLLSRGADPTLAADGGKNVLDWANEEGDQRVLDVLRKAGVR